MKAVQLLAHGAPGKFAWRDVADPSPKDDEVVLRVRACGLNRLDLWAEENALPIKMELPRTPGSEISGEILSLGKNISGWSIGERVAVQSNLFCGECEFCARGRESLCLRGEIVGMQRDGGFAEQVAVPARALIRLPASVSFESAAALTLAASTAVHMLTSRVKVRSGDWVLVIGGASGVGSAAIQIAKHFGAYVIATGSTEAKRKFSLELGAHHAVDSADKDWAGEVRKITGKRGVDIVVEHVGGAVLRQAFASLARGGTIVTCGATAGREVEIKLWPLFVKEQSLVGSYGRNRADIEATFELAARGKLKAAIDRIFPLNETADAFARLRAREVMGKLVVSASH
ncbi:MAG: zinc-binding dehydrogenase [Verrucomicrobiota bacterium]